MNNSKYEQEQQESMVKHREMSEVVEWSVLHKNIWNAAIEAALNEAMSDSEIFEAIRRLKK